MELFRTVKFLVLSLAIKAEQDTSVGNQFPFHALKCGMYLKMIFGWHVLFRFYCAVSLLSRECIKVHPFILPRPERGAFSRLEVYKREGISRVEVY